MTAPVEDRDFDPWYEAWGAFFEHLQPSAPGASPCPVCVAAPGPNLGCDEGRRLYGAYRLARIGEPPGRP